MLQYKRKVKSRVSISLIAPKIFNSEKGFMLHLALAWASLS